LKIDYGFQYSSIEQFLEIKSINLNVRLAKLEKKLHLIFSSYREDIRYKENLQPIYKDIPVEKNKFALGLLLKESIKPLSFYVKTGITTVNKLFSSITVLSPKLLIKSFSLEVEEKGRYEFDYIKHKRSYQEYTRLITNKLIYKNTILSFLISRTKFSDKPYNVYTLSTAIVKIIGKHKKNLISTTLSNSGNKIIGAYPTLYSASIGYRYKFYKWAYFNFDFGVKWQRIYDFQNEPYVRANFEIYFGKW